MKANRLAMLCAGAAPLILSGAAPAGFLGIMTRSADNPFSVYVDRIYAVFDRPGDDEMLAVFGTPEDPLTVTINGGSFYQHNFGSDLAPNATLVEFIPSLAFDTFVTIGVRSVGTPNGQPVNETTLLPAWPGFGPSELTTTTSGWSVPSGSPQADPFDPVNAFPGNSTILIGQFCSVPGFDDASMLIQYRSNGVIEESLIEFVFGLIRCTDDCDCIDHPCFGTSICDGSFCEQQSYPSPDCNGNRVLDSCEIDFGTSQDLNGNGVPDECDPPCPWDCADGDGHIGIAEFLAVLGTWGRTGVPCDVNGDGVGIDDFLAVLGLWGPCQ